MLRANCSNCNLSVPIYLLEKHSLDHKEEQDKEDKEEEDRKHMLMVADIKVNKSEKRVPSEKVKDQQDAEVHGKGQRVQPTAEVKEHAIAEEEEDDTKPVLSKNEASLADIFRGTVPGTKRSGAPRHQRFFASGAPYPVQNHQGHFGS